MVDGVVVAGALAGGLWRWVDGRGYGPNWARMGAGGLLAWFLLAEFGLWAIPLAVLFMTLWTFRQKQREELDDMMLRWAAAFAVYGALLAFGTRDAGSFAIMALAGVGVAVLVWAGVRYPMDRLDSTAVAEAASGALAFGALAAAV